MPGRRARAACVTAVLSVTLGLAGCGANTGVLSLGTVTGDAGSVTTPPPAGAVPTVTGHATFTPLGEGEFELNFHGTCQDPAGSPSITIRSSAAALATVPCSAQNEWAHVPAESETNLTQAFFIDATSTAGQTRSVALPFMTLDVSLDGSLFVRGTASANTRRLRVTSSSNAVLLDLPLPSGGAFDEQIPPPGDGFVSYTVLDAAGNSYTVKVFHFTPAF